MNPTQSNVIAGKIKTRKAGQDLTNKEGFLCLLVLVAGLGVVKLPAAITDVTPFIVDEGAALDGLVSIDPLSPDRQYRIKCVGVIQPGAQMVLAIGADAGQLRAVPGPSAPTAGSYRVIARCEEEKPTANGQFVLCRPTYEPLVVVAAT